MCVYKWKKPATKDTSKQSRNDCDDWQFCQCFGFLCLFVSADPNVILPIGLLLGGATFLFILSVVTYRLFEMDIVLWLRRAFPVLYANTGECRQRLPSALRSCFLCTCSYCYHLAHNGPNVRKAACKQKWGTQKENLKSLQNTERPSHKPDHVSTLIINSETQANHRVSSSSSAQMSIRNRNFIWRSGMSLNAALYHY